ncbi:MAG: glycerophosphodiester phosphodiesterase [Lachnospiraceae bacterium]|nr:glycerophosphodiester phosphodiesterase [Lachnospiraceae bacterium]
MNTIVIVLICCVEGLAVLYLLMIMPRMMHKADDLPFRKVLYAHRGLYDNDSRAPENSMAAFKKAVEGGYGIELDVQLTKDKIPVVFHDYTLKRVCGVEGKVCDYTFEELQEFKLCQSGEKIPRFEDVLTLVDGKVPLIIEYKIEAVDTSVCTLADQMLQKYNGLYCIESFNPLALVWYRRNHPQIMRGQLSDAFWSRKELKGILYMILEKLLLNFLTKPDFVAYNHKEEKQLSRRLCRSLYRNTAVAWTIMSEEDLKAARDNFDMFIFDSFIPKGGSRA